MKLGKAIAPMAAIALMTMGSTSAAYAQATPSLGLEFNGLEASDNGCRLTFVVKNGFETAVTRAAFEFALFNAQGVVDRLTVLEFRDLPAGKTKVTRFNLSGADCSQIGRILVNEVTDCTGEGVDTAACRAALKTESRSDKIEFGL